jgi:hemerythrin-like domain-containing protein
MKPIGPLMIEHRLIEKMVALLAAELRHVKTGGVIDRDFISAAVDFFRTYADRTHHGKEEDILFKELESKTLTPELNRTMAELIAEHVLARKTVSALNDAAARDSGNNRGSAINDVIQNLTRLVELYPKHIEKEDKHFFFPVLDYFNSDEQDKMLQAFFEFDRNMIHEKYRKVVENLKNR